MHPSDRRSAPRARRADVPSCAGRQHRVLRFAGSAAIFLAFALPVLAQAPPPPIGRDRSAPAPAAVWSVTEIPGPLDALARAAGILVPVERTRVVLEIARLAYGVAEARDPVTDKTRARLAAYLLGQPAPGATPVQVPLPLPPQVWIDAVFQRRLPAADLGVGILKDSQAALLYHGLFALDDGTLAYLGDSRNRALAACLANARVFSTFGRSFHVRHGRVDVPGGEPAVALWEALVGAKVTEPAAFAGNLLSRERGWLAYFYDTIAHLDPPRLAFALGFFTDAPGARVGRLRALFAATVQTDLAWVPAERPFARPTHDAALLFREVRLTPEGRFAPPASRRLWKLAFGNDGTGSDLRGMVQPAAQDEVDAAFLAEQVLAPSAEVRQERFEMVLFAQRLTGGAFKADPTDTSVAGRVRSHEEVGNLLAVLRGMRRFRALALTLERIGVRDPSVHASAVRAAERLMTVAGDERRRLTIVQFQAALALIDRLTARHQLTPAAATAAVTSLLRVPLVTKVSAVSSENTVIGYEGGIGHWLASALLPALPAPTRPGADARSPEHVLLNGLAGPLVPRGSDLATARVTWEGETYAIDLGAAEFARMRRAREEIGGTDLDLALALSVLAASSHDPVPDGGAIEATLKPRPTYLPGLGAMLERARQAIGRWQAGVIAVAGTPPRPVEDLRRIATRALERAVGAKTGPQLAEALAPLGPVADLVLADSLASIIYGIRIGRVEGLLGAGELVAAHDFNFSCPPSNERLAGPWAVPTEVKGGGRQWHLTGSLLAIDVPFARLALHRISSEAPPVVPTLATYDSQTFEQSVALLDPYVLTDREQAAMVEAIGRGVERLNALPRGHDASATEAATGLAAAAHLSEWRANGLRWAVAEEPDAVGAWFSLCELLWLGVSPPLGGDTLHPWGVSAYGLSTLLALRFPQPAPWENFTGRAFGGILATRIPDLNLRLAEWLARFHLPAALLPAIAQMAMQDVLFEAQPSDPNDWTAIVRSAQNVERTRFEDYVSALTAEGPLVPAPGAGATARPPGKS